MDRDFQHSAVGWWRCGTSTVTWTANLTGDCSITTSLLYSQPPDPPCLPKASNCIVSIHLELFRLDWYGLITLFSMLVVIWHVICELNCQSCSRSFHDNSMVHPPDNPIHPFLLNGVVSIHQECIKDWIDRDLQHSAICWCWCGASTVTWSANHAGQH